jgi:hypothetical protein
MNAGTRERQRNHEDFVHSSCLLKRMTLLPSHFVISTLHIRPDSLEWLVPGLVDDLDMIHLESAEDVLINLKIHLECRVRAGHLLRAVVTEDKQTCISAVLLSLSKPLEPTCRRNFRPD